MYTDSFEMSISSNQWGKLESYRWTQVGDRKVRAHRASITEILYAWNVIKKKKKKKKGRRKIFFTPPPPPPALRNSWQKLSLGSTDRPKKIFFDFFFFNGVFVFWKFQWCLLYMFSLFDHRPEFICKTPTYLIHIMKSTYLNCTSSFSLWLN